MFHVEQGESCENRLKAGVWLAGEVLNQKKIIGAVVCTPQSNMLILPAQQGLSVRSRGQSHIEV